MDGRRTGLPCDALARNDHARIVYRRREKRSTFGLGASAEKDEHGMSANDWRAFILSCNADRIAVPRWMQIAARNAQLKAGIGVHE